MKKMIWPWHLPHVGEQRHIYSVKVRTPERKGSLGKHRYRWEDNTIIILILKKYDGRMWTGFVWLRIGSSCWLL
jgi:hypothetical protein